MAFMVGDSFALPAHVWNKREQQVSQWEKNVGKIRVRMTNKSGRRKIFPKAGNRGANLQPSLSKKPIEEAIQRSYQRPSVRWPRAHVAPLKMKSICVSAASNWPNARPVLVLDTLVSIAR